MTDKDHSEYSQGRRDNDRLSDGRPRRKTPRELAVEARKAGMRDSPAAPGTNTGVQIRR